jgi:hypothetical protein
MLENDVKNKMDRVTNDEIFQSSKEGISLGRRKTSTTILKASRQKHRS